MEGTLALSAWLVTANLVGWPLIHLLVSWIFMSLAPVRFDPQSPLFRTKSWENNGKFYLRFFGIKSWKTQLPDAAAWFSGGFAKKKLRQRDEAYLHRFVIETCRGEAAHWATMLCCPIFFFWNPLWASAVMVFYALISNLPCILTQRYNRIVLQRMRFRDLRAPM